MTKERSVAPKPPLGFDAFIDERFPELNNAINMIVETSFAYRIRDLKCSQTKCLKPSLDYFPMFESFIVASHAA